jgi:hypothetical protein
MLLDLHILHGTARFELKNEVRVPLSRAPRRGTLTEKYIFINEAVDSKVLHIPTGQFYHLPPPDFESVSI